MREAIKIIKAMFSGERLSYQGRIFMARNVMLDPAPEKPIPIYVAARGQKMLALAGELADGVLLQTPSENVDPLVQTIRAGCDKSGRNLNDLDIFNYVILSVSASDPQAARESVRLHVAWIISDSPASVLEKIGVTAERVDRIRLALRKDVTEASSLVTDDMIDALSVAGSSNMCRERIQTLLAKTRSNLVFSIKPNYEEAISFLRGEVLDAPS
jgi:5,10-methylenetetrahydromethanopterin reductase